MADGHALHRELASLFKNFNGAFLLQVDTLTDMCGLWKIVAVGGMFRLTYLVPIPELDIEFIGLDTNFEWQCDTFKHVDCGDSKATRRMISSTSMGHR